MLDSSRLISELTDKRLELRALGGTCGEALAAWTWYSSEVTEEAEGVSGKLNPPDDSLIPMLLPGVEAMAGMAYGLTAPVAEW